MGVFSGVAPEASRAVRPPRAEARAAAEPGTRRRIHRWPDLLRLLTEVLAIATVVLLGKFAVHTTSGVEADVHDNSIELAPAFLLGGITVLTNIVTAAVPVGLAIERLIRREGTRVADAVVAALLASGLAAVLNRWITSHYAPGWLLAELTRRLSSGSSPPLHVYITAVLAFLTVLGFNDRPALRTFTWASVGVYATVTLMSGGGALVGLVLSFMLGRAIAFGWRYARGVAELRPSSETVRAELVGAGLEIAFLHRLSEHDEVARYEAGCADGRRLDVTVLDQDRRRIGAIYRFYRRIRLRGPAQRRNLFSNRRTVEHEALVSYALAEAGISTPRLLAVRKAEAGSILVAYERTHTCPLSQIPRKRITDALLERVFSTVRDLGRHQIAHRRLSLESILVDGGGRIWLTELRDGEVAAGELQHLLDVACVTTALSLKVGPERAVRIGARILGEDTVIAALSVLQPAVLTGVTRVAARKSKTLPRLREQILKLRPHPARIEPLKLERLNPRTLLAAAAGGVAVYLLMLEISSAGGGSGHGLEQMLGTVSPGWLLIAAAAAAATYVAATMQLIGFVAERLPKAQVLLVQLSSSFIALFAPAAVGGVALNVRYLSKRGIPTGPAVSAVGTSQAVAFLVHIGLIAVFSFTAGSGGLHDAASTVMIAILLALAVLAMVTVAVEPLRRFAGRRLKFFEGSLPRLLDIAQRPSKLASALGGTVALSLLNALCLWACVYALGDGAHAGYPTVTLIYLTVQAASSISPTPAGIGAVEIGLGGALALVGVPKQHAVVAVLAYRLLTTYLPGALGYAALHRLRRKDAV